METAQFLEVKKNMVEALLIAHESKESYKVKYAQDWDELYEYISENIGLLTQSCVLVPDGHYKNDWREFTVVNGKLHGILLEYSEDGRIDCKITYINGELIDVNNKTI